MTHEVKSNNWLKCLRTDHWNQRYTLCIMGIIGCTSMSTNRICLNHAIEVITSEQEGNPPEFLWTSIEQGWAKASYFIGFIPSSIPGGLLADHFGGKVIFGFGCTCSAVATILIPPITRQTGLTGMIILRIIMGAGEAMTFPAGSNLLSKWVPPLERGRLAGFIFTAPQLGLIVGNIGSGFMLRDFDWPISFYVWGSICLVYCVAFYFFCYTEPRYHPFISRRELEFLNENVIGVSEDRNGTCKLIPWRHIITSIRVWSIIFCVFGFYWCYFSIIMDVPKFMHHIMQFGTAERGIMTSILFVVMYTSSLVSCYSADILLKKNFLKRLTLRKLYAFISTVLPAVSVVCAYYSGSHVPALTICLFAISLAFMAFYYNGVQINSLDLSPRNSGLVTAFVNTFGASAAFLAPVVNGCITATNKEPDWCLVGWMSFAFMTGGVILFLLFASAERQWWDSQDKVDEYNRRRKLEKRLRELQNSKKQEAKKDNGTSGNGENDYIKEEQNTVEDREEEPTQELSKESKELLNKEDDQEGTKPKGILKKDTDEGERKSLEDGVSIKGILKKGLDDHKVEFDEEEKRVTIQKPEEEAETREQEKEKRKRENEEAGKSTK